MKTNTQGPQVAVRRLLLERVDWLLTWQSCVVTMKMPGRTDYGVYLELDGGYQRDDGFEMAVYYRDQLAEVRDELRAALGDKGWPE